MKGAGYEEIDAKITKIPLLSDQPLKCPLHSQKMNERGLYNSDVT